METRTQQIVEHLQLDPQKFGPAIQTMMQQPAFQKRL